MAKVYYACMFDWESNNFYSFFQGTQEECHAKVTKMANVLGVDPVTRQQCKEDPSEADGRPVVISENPCRTAITQVKEAFGDSYEAGKAIMAGYPYTPKDIEEGMEQTWFQPVSRTSFSPGDSIILAQFIPSAPGGWIVVNLDLTRKERWQEGTIADTEGDA